VSDSSEKNTNMLSERTFTKMAHKNDNKFVAVGDVFYAPAKHHLILVWLCTDLISDKLVGCSIAPLPCAAQESMLNLISFVIINPFLYSIRLILQTSKLGSQMI
jgi:hypothetical protein